MGRSTWNKRSQFQQLLILYCQQWQNSRVWLISWTVQLNNKLHLSMNILQLNCPSTCTSNHTKQFKCPNAGTVLLQNIHAEIKLITFIALSS